MSRLRAAAAPDIVPPLPSSPPPPPPPPSSSLPPPLLLGSPTSPPFPSHPPFPPRTTPTSSTTSSTRADPLSDPLSPPSSNNISRAEVVGIAVGGVVAVSVVLTLLICLTKNKKKKVSYPGNHYRPPRLPTSYTEPQYESDTRQQWDQSSVSSEVGKMPPPPPPPPFPLSESFFIPTRIKSPTPPDPQGLAGTKSSFVYKELESATDNFASANLLGEGGFGCVYRGVLPGGHMVAVKQLKVGGGQGEKEFRAEVEIISRVHHRHLVSLVGYCIAGSQRLLVYDFVSNGTLEFHLHEKGRPIMDWRTRVKIAVGAARGLAYLHEDCHPRIIHRDIKSSNILLDDNFEAQVSDFGLAKLTNDSITHVTTRVMGTFGYLAPEYASSGKVTDKSDVYSFGVVLLELVTGRRPVDPSGDEGLVEWARPMLTQVLEGESDLAVLADPRLNGNFDKNEMMHMIEAATACVRHSADKRPRMGQVARALEDDVNTLRLYKGVRHGNNNVYNAPYETTDFDNSQHSTNLKKFRHVALVPQEHGTGSSVQTTSEDGPNPSASSSDYQTSREADRIGKLGDNIIPIGLKTDISASSSNEYPTSQELEICH